MINFKIISKEEYLKHNKKPDQLRVWNAIAKPWKTYIVKKIPIVEEFLKNKKGKVIDLGCGTGRNMILNSNISYYGVDFSEEQLKQAKDYIKKNKINAKIYKLYAYDLSRFYDNYFDYGLFMSTLHCLENEYQRLRALKEFYRVLKPNAIALISVWNSKDKRFKHVDYHGDIYMSWSEDNIPYMRSYYLYHKEELMRLIKSVGFKILHFYEHENYDRFSKKNWIIKVEK